MVVNSGLCLGSIPSLRKIRPISYTFKNHRRWPGGILEIAVQVNGKVRSRLTVDAGISAQDAIAAAKADEKIASMIASGTVIKELYVPGKLVNLVVKP